MSENKPKIRVLDLFSGILLAASPLALRWHPLNLKPWPSVSRTSSARRS